MHKRYTGFTIVELLVVIVLIGILAAISLVSYVGLNTRAYAAAMQADASSASGVVKLYNADTGYYPAQIDPGTGCPTQPANTSYCLKPTSPNQFIYAPTDSSRTDYVLISTNTTGNVSSYTTSSSSRVTTLNPVVASGGNDVSTIGKYKVHKFSTPGPGSLTVTSGGVAYVEVNGAGGGGGACYYNAGIDGEPSTLRVSSGPVFTAAGGIGGSDGYGDSHKVNSGGPGIAAPYYLFGANGAAGNGGAGANAADCGDGNGDNGGAGARVYGHVYLATGASVSVVIGNGGNGGNGGSYTSGGTGGNGSVVIKYLIQ
jgi:prepilin-type N-terminal cleavage/methylation domain-containing protein